MKVRPLFHLAGFLLSVCVSVATSHAAIGSGVPCKRLAGVLNTLSPNTYAPMVKATALATRFSEGRMRLSKAWPDGIDILRQIEIGFGRGDAKQAFRKEALELAHLVGEKRTGPYTSTELLRKARILRMGGFTRSESEALLRGGVAGEKARVNAKAGGDTPVASLSGDVDALKRAIKANEELGRLEKSKGMPSLNDEIASIVQGLEDPDSSVRGFTLKALIARQTFRTAHGPEKEVLIRAIVKNTKPTDESLGIVLEALSNTDSSLQFAAAHQLSQSWGSSPESAQAFVSALRALTAQGKGFDVRWHLATQLTEMLLKGEKVSPTLLANALEDPHYYVREPVESVLTKNPKILAEQPAEVRLRHRISMATAEGHTPDLSAVPPLFKSDPKVVEATLVKQEAAEKAVELKKVAAAQSVVAPTGPAKKGFFEGFFREKTIDERVAKLKLKLAKEARKGRTESSRKKREETYSIPDKNYFAVLNELVGINTPESTSVLLKEYLDLLPYEHGGADFQIRKILSSTLQNRALSQEHIKSIVGDIEVKQIKDSNPREYFPLFVLLAHSEFGQKHVSRLALQSLARVTHGYQDHFFYSKFDFSGSRVGGHFLTLMEQEVSGGVFSRKTAQGSELWSDALDTIRTGEKTALALVEAMDPKSPEIDVALLEVIEASVDKRNNISESDIPLIVSNLVTRAQQDSQYLASVMSKLKSPHSKMRETCISLLANFDKSNKQVDQTLLMSALKDENPNVRAAARGVYLKRKVADSADAEIIFGQLLKNRSNPQLLSDGFELLAGSIHRDEVNRFAVQLAFSGETPAIRELGAHVATKAQVSDLAALEPAIAQLQSPDLNTRYNALRIVSSSKVSDSRIDAAIGQALHDDDGGFRAVALDSIQHRPLRDPSTIRSLRDLYDKEFSKGFGSGPVPEKLRDLMDIAARSDLNSLDAVHILRDAIEKNEWGQELPFGGILTALAKSPSVTEPKAIEEIILLYKSTEHRRDGNMNNTWGRVRLNLMNLIGKSKTKSPVVLDFLFEQLGRSHVDDSSMRALIAQDPQESYVIGRLIASYSKTDSERLKLRILYVLAHLSSRDPRIDEQLTSLSNFESHLYSVEKVNDDYITRRIAEVVKKRAERLKGVAPE